MLRVKSYQLKSILILSIFKIFLALGIVTLYLTESRERFTVHFFILFGIIIFFTILQMLICFLTLKKAVVDYNGISVLNKRDTKLIAWAEIKEFSYHNELIILEPHTLKIVCAGNQLLFGEDFLNIHISLKKYKQAVKYIPSEILNSNTLFLYPSTYLYEKDQYKLYDK